MTAKLGPYLNEMKAESGEGK